MDWRGFVVERLVPGGEGFGRAPDGRAVFVPGATPGDVLDVSVIEQRGSFARVVAATRTTDGPERRVAPCPYQSRCGGCDWQQLTEAAQAQAKVALVREALRRTGRIEHEPLEFVPAPATTGYRTRVRLHIGANGELGLHERDSHRVVPIDRCLVLTPRLEAALGELRRRTAELSAALSAFTGVELRAAPNQALAVEARWFAREDAPGVGSAARTLRTALEGEFAVSFDGEPAPLEALQLWPLDASGSPRRSLPVLPGAFTQVGWAMNQQLVAAIVSGAQQRGLRTFFDLYAGAGNFSFPLLDAGLDGTAVELTGASIRGARAHAESLGLSADRFIAGDVERWCRRAVETGASAELVLADPPRAGLGATATLLPRLASRAIALVSCDPVALARDLRLLLEAGCVLETVTVFDLFPQTHHAEVVAWLQPPAATHPYVASAPSTDRT